MKQEELVTKSDESNLVNTSDLNTNIATFATKAELKAEQDKIVRQKTFNLSYYLGKNVFW